MSRVIKREENPMNITNEHVEQLKSFIRGEVTWAEVEGMSFEEARAIAQVGCELAASGRIEEARTIFEGLVAGNPKDSGAQAALGTVYQKLGRNEDALAAYDASIQADASNPVALANRGELRLKSGDRQGFADLARAVESDPHGETASARRAKALVTAIAVQAVENSKAREKVRVEK